MPQQPTHPATDWAAYIRNLLRRHIFLALLVIFSVLLYVDNHVYASSKTLYEELNKSNYTILGLTLGDSFRQDILSKLGPTLMIKDEKTPDVNHLCYISDRDETLIVFGFKDGQCRRFQMISHKNQFYKWHFCAVSPLVTEEMSTQSGITLGMHQDLLKAIFGIPKKDSNEILIFEYKRKKQMEKEELNKESQCFEEMNNVSSRIVSIYVEARFVDFKLKSFDMSWR